MVQIVILLDFHWTKSALWLVDSWSCAPDQIQMYPDNTTSINWSGIERDTIAQLFPARRLCLFVFAIWLFKGKSKYMTKMENKII